MCIRYFLCVGLLFFGSKAIILSQTNTDISLVKQILTQMQGDFVWEMWRPSENKLLRTGTSQSSYQLDSMVLLVREKFANTPVEMIGLWGYDRKTNDFFSLSSFNGKNGTHYMRGQLDTNRRPIQITFIEDQKTRNIITFIGKDEHQWRSERLKNGIWVKNDLKIIFKRLD